MYQTHANNMRELRIGRQGENAVRQILFDISDWAAELGPGTAELIFQRSGREDPYPVMVGLDGNTIIWTVTERDTEYPYRNGKCELRYYVTGRDGVAKSRMWTTYVEPSIETPAGDPPETEQGWFDQVISAGADAKAFAESAKIDADRAEAAAIRQPYPDAESGTWWIWDAVAGEYVDSGVSLGQELMEQVLAAIGNLDDLKTSDKSSLVAAINEIIRSGVSGGVDPADIAKAVEDYMAEHPIQETDPTVHEWAKQPEKPAYTAAEVHALPDTYTPTVDAALSGISTNPVQNKAVTAKLSEVESIAKGRSTGHVFETETDMRTWIAANASVLNLGDNLYIRATDVPDYWWDGTSAQPLETQKVDLTEYAKKSDVPSVDATLTKSGQAADAAKVGDELRSLSGKIVSTAEDKVATHNTGTDTHSDIRLLIQGLTDRLNALADSDDTTLDQLSEVVAYIKSNRTLIEAVTTSKVSVADIIDNLTTNVSNKPLSAAQGVALKALIDGIVVPDKLPNPNALTFTGAVSGSYDGSAPLEVKIPSGGGAAGDYIQIPASAKVGQTIVVKAVDDGGKPTEWEAADVGGWDLIADITLTEDGGGASLNVTRNDKGEDFEYRQCMVCISGTVIDGWPSGAYIKIMLYESNELTGSHAGSTLTRLPAGAGGTWYKTTVEVSIFGNLVRTIACGGSTDTSSLIIRGESSIDTFRSIKMSGYGNNQWVSLPLAAGGRVVIYGRK